MAPSETVLCNGLEALLQPFEVPAECRPSDFKPVPIVVRLGSRDARLLLVEKIGEGGFGRVYRAEMEEDRTVSYAVKCLCMDRRKTSVTENEIAMHHYASHNFDELSREDPRYEHGVVRFSGFKQRYHNDNHSDVFIATEYCPDGDLCSFLTKDSYQPTDAYVKLLFLQIVDAVWACHKIKLYHRDLKPDNVFVKDGGQRVVLGDFGFATNKRRQSHFDIGSAPYMSPELRGREKFCAAKADIWALGIILVALITRSLPWDESVLVDNNYAYYALMDRDYLIKRYDLSTEVNDILKDIFTEADNRITMRELRSRIANVQTFGSGTLLHFDMDLGKLKSRVRQTYGPDHALALELEMLSQEANSCVVTLSTNLSMLRKSPNIVIPTDHLNVWNNLRRQLGDRKDYLETTVNRYYASDRDRNKCKEKAKLVRRCHGRLHTIHETLKSLDGRLERFRSIKARQDEGKAFANSAFDITSTALNAMSNILTATSDFVNGNKACTYPGPSNFFNEPLPPPVPALGSGSSNVFFRVPMAAIPDVIPDSGSSSGEDSEGPVTPETLPVDPATIALPPCTPALEKDIEELDLEALESGFAAVSIIRKPPPVAVAGFPGSAAADNYAVPPVPASTLLAQFPAPPGAFGDTMKMAADQGTGGMDMNLDSTLAKAYVEIARDRLGSGQSIFQTAARIVATPLGLF